MFYQGFTQRLALLTLFMAVCFLSFAQSKINYSGTYEGTHYELEDSSEVDTSFYLYKFELTQDSNRIEGKSYIYNEEGYYAVVHIRGVILEEKMYFEEYATIDEINPVLNHWCYNSGHLDISRSNNTLTLNGFTKSFSKNYDGFCHSGYTTLQKTSYLENNNMDELRDKTNEASKVIVSPNPSEGYTEISFNLFTEQTAIIEVYDLAGELITRPLNKNLLPGSFTFPIDLSFEKEGMYIVELIIGRELHTTELWKGNF